MPTLHGTIDVIVYRGNETEMFASTKGELVTGEPLFVRVHSECFTGEVLGSLKCDCADQLAQALDPIAARGRGVVVCLHQEGRGVGLGNKIRGSALQSMVCEPTNATHRSTL